MKVLVPSAYRVMISGHDIVDYDPTKLIPAEHYDAEVLVVRGNSPANLQDAAAHLPTLRLVQTLSAGADAVLSAGFEGAVVSCGRSLHDHTVSEHTLAMVLALVRAFPELAQAQRERHWDVSFRERQAAPHTAQRFTLRGAHVVIWGFGSIAAALAPLLEALGARVTGIATSAGLRYGFEVVGVDAIGEWLPKADVLISLLPKATATESLVGTAVFELLPEHAIFVNVGRGATVDEAALRFALETGEIRAAAIDVARVEPLPADDPLWGVRNLLITPHIAGGRPHGAGDLLQENLDALARGEPLRNVVRR